MTKKHFTEQLASKLGEFYSSDDYSIRSEVITKNNDTRLHGIIIQKRGDPLSPTIYVDDYYRDYLAEKMTLAEVAEQMCTVLKNLEGHTEKYRSFSVEFASCHDKIVYRLVSRKRNAYFLKEVPYLPFLDLAILFYVVCDMTENGLESMRVSKELMERWQTNTGQLMKLAVENTPRLFPLKIESMDRVITEYLGIPNEFHLRDGSGLAEKLCGNWEMPMLIVSNEQGINGASVILYEDTIANLAEQFGSNLYILPSSVHEVIVLPEQEYGTREELSRIVQDINRSHVRFDEFLSDQAYFYNREDKRFEY